MFSEAPGLERERDARATRPDLPPEPKMRVALQKAQATGDVDATGTVVMYVLKRFKGVLHKFTPPIDPAYDWDDVLGAFTLGVLKAVPIVDGRGCDFYHLCRRGLWFVSSSMMRQATRQAKGRTFDGLKPVTHEGDVLDLMEVYQDRTTPDFVEILCDQDEARQKVTVFVNMPLSGREREVLDLIRSGVCGDPRRKGWRKDAAAHMGISPQRLSQIISGNPTNGTPGLVDKLAAALEA